jgi:hypothetical protein
LYVEGGGDSDSKARLRIAFAQFFSNIRTTAEKKGFRLRVIPSGSRSDTFINFRNTLLKQPDALCFLLVDAERSVTDSPRDHLAAPPDRWERTGTEERYHLMVQVMEAWMLADPEALKAFYGAGFRASALPRTQIVEEIDKRRVASSLKRATGSTQRGEYHKIRHAPLILETLDPAKVRARAPHCERLFTTLLDQLS